MLLFFGILIVFLFPFPRMFVSNILSVIKYSILDLIDYIRFKRWKDFRLYGIDHFCGMFGHGKTLAVAHRAEMLYKKFGDDILIYSNFTLKNIPYVPLINFNQLVDIGDGKVSGYKGYVICIDEIQSLLSHRNFANFPTPLIGILTTQRHLHVYIMSTSQRYAHVDKLYRDICTNVIDCDKFWRFCRWKVYDAWDVEQATNSHLVRAKKVNWWLCSNKDYAAYSTEEMISSQSAKDFISNDEILARQGGELVANVEGIRHKSKKLKKTSKAVKK